MHKKTDFLTARPVWIKGKETEKNVTALFVAQIGQGQMQINITASCIYRMFINGRLIAYGPARGPHGYFRIDRIDLTDYCTNEKNFVAIEVAGYNVNSYYLLDQPSFLQAEILKDGIVVARTAKDGDFSCRIVHQRQQKVQRYSTQRTFAEAWSVDKAYYDAYTSFPAQNESLSEYSPFKYLERGVSFATMAESNIVQIVSSGVAQYKTDKVFDFKGRSLVCISPELKGYTEEELSFGLTEEASHLHFLRNSHGPRNVKYPEFLSGGEWITGNFRCNLSGFIKLKVKALKKSRLTLLFDELLQENDVNPWRMRDCCNDLDLTLDVGEYTFISYEPSTLSGL